MTSKPATPSAEEKAKVKVVVADDSPLVRRRIISLLKEVNEVDIVGEAEDGPSALAAATEAKPDVIVMDIQMPGLTGLEVLRRLQHKPSAPKVIMVTNYAFPQYREKCLQAGASYFFDKSADFDQIAEAIRSLRREKAPNHNGGSRNTNGGIGAPTTQFSS
jgi:DNA-binding NarL/FixJ family response regulator